MAPITIPSVTIPVPKIPNKIISAWDWAKAPMSEVNIPKVGNVGDILTKGAGKFNGIAEATKQGELFASEGKVAGRLAKGLKVLKGAAAAKGATVLEALKGVPKGFVLIPAAIEFLQQIPKMIEGFKEGRGGAQLGNTAMNVAGVAGGAWAGFAAATAIGTAILPGIGTVAGMIVGAAGAFIGSSIGKKIGSIAGKFSFGENHETETQPQPQQVAQQQTPAQAPNPFAMSGMNDLYDPYNDPMMMPGFFDLPPQDQRFAMQVIGQNASVN